MPPWLLNCEHATLLRYCNWHSDRITRRILFFTGPSSIWIYHFHCKILAHGRRIIHVFCYFFRVPYILLHLLLPIHFANYLASLRKQFAVCVSLFQSDCNPCNPHHRCKNAFLRFYYFFYKKRVFNAF